MTPAVDAMTAKEFNWHFYRASKISMVFEVMALARAFMDPTTKDGMAAEPRVHKISMATEGASETNHGSEHPPSGHRLLKASGVFR